MVLSPQAPIGKCLLVEFSESSPRKGKATSTSGSLDLTLLLYDTPSSSVPWYRHGELISYTLGPLTALETMDSVFDSLNTTSTSNVERESNRRYTRHRDECKESVDRMVHLRISLSRSAQTLRGYDRDSQTRPPYIYRKST